MRVLYQIAKRLSIFILPLFLSGCYGAQIQHESDNKGTEIIDSVFRFIHISDTHGSTVSINAVNQYCEKHKCDFAVLTGDVLPNNSIIQSITHKPLEYLVIPGNHDAWKSDGLGQTRFRTSFLDGIKSTVHFPSTNINYWYKDYEKVGKRLRVIGLDQFELDSFVTQAGLLAKMTQKQMDWFVKTLMDSNNFDAIIVLIHMGFGNKLKGQRDTSVHNAFISMLANRYDNSYDFYNPDDPFMIPEIIEAYTNGETLNKIYNKDSENEIVVNAPFVKPTNNFIGYFGGHLHWDEVEYLSAFPKQLQCLVAFCGSGIGSNYNDLIKTDYAYLFNVVEVDLWHNELRITREGASQTSFGTNRSSISFQLFN